MTRFTRVKSTHQRVETDSTTWTELKATPAKDDTKNHRDAKKVAGGASGGPSPSGRKFNNSNNGSANGRGGGGSGGGRKFQKRRPERRDNGRNNNQESANFTPLGGKNPNVRGEGATKSVKVFGNFWVGEGDARRLQGMAKKLKDEGVSRKVILDSLQGERRKAEKASKRRRDKTCFNCRQFGHVLSDCPTISKTGEGGEGDGKDAKNSSEGDICFKCGSTEHISRFCKKKSDKFSFAKCFICSKSGHIARQCPSNQNGIYPSGGSCDECGSVQHLKKDCPDVGGGAAGNNNNDPEAQVGRISNPFVSTEYEELPILSSDAVEKEARDEDDAETEAKQKQEQRKPKFNKNKNNKRPHHSNPNDNFSKEPVETPSNNQSDDPSKGKSNNPPKKRKVVKF